jgi:hypothetical protein
VSQVKIQGHASGTGIFTVTSPNSNTDRTLTLPDATGTLVLSGNGASFSTLTVNNDNISATNSLGFRNRIINGNMRIDQRNAGASVTPGGFQYTLDRWFFDASQASKFTVQRNAGSVTPPAGFTNYLGLTVASSVSIGASDYFMIGQTIEGFNVGDLAFGTASAQTVTLSFGVRSSLTGTFGGVVKNGASNRSYPFTYSVSAANTWEQKTVTIAGDTTGTWATDNGAGLVLLFGLGVGSNLSAAAGSWTAANRLSATGATSVVGTNGATFYITGVQLEAGSVATPFERIDYGRQLIQCQRYYYTTYAQGTAVGTATATNSVFRTLDSTASFATLGTFLKVSMRASPTTTVYSTTGASGFIYDVNGAANRAAYSQSVGTEYIAFGIDGISLSGGTGIRAHFVASIEL